MRHDFTQLRTGSIKAGAFHGQQSDCLLHNKLLEAPCSQSVNRLPYTSHFTSLHELMNIQLLHQPDSMASSKPENFALSYISHSHGEGCSLINQCNVTFTGCCHSQMTGVRIVLSAVNGLQALKVWFLKNVQTGSRAHSASYSVDTKRSFTWVKAARA